MNKDILFKILKQKDQPELLSILDTAWELMTTNQREQIFGPLIRDQSYDFPASPEKTLVAIKAFQQSSLAGNYYAPFDINSKNYMDIPEETDAWFAKLDELFIECNKLSEQQDYHAAVEGFEILFDLFEQIYDDSIVFADELGSWMYPGDEKANYTAYLKAAAAIYSPDDFADKAMAAIIEDSHQSCSLKLYSLVKSIASQEQMALVEERVQERGISVA